MRTVNFYELLKEVSIKCTKGYILIVEDDPDIRHSMELFILDEGYEVRTAENGKIALDIVREPRKPCLVFLDLMMPVMNGWEFLAIIEKEGLLHDIPIVVVTAAGSSKVPKEITFLTKPVNLDRLEHYATRYCRGREEKP